MAYGTIKVDNVTTSTGTVVINSLAPKASPIFTGDVTINAQGDLRLADSDSSHYVAFQAGGTIGTNYTIEFPTTVGATGKVLKSTVSGQVATLTWETDSATDSTKLPLDGSGVMTGDLKFEGATADAYETIVTPTDATGSDKTITLPNATGTVSLLTNTETLTNKTLTAPTITAPTISGATDLTGAVLTGASPLVFEGSTADAHELTLAITDITSSDKTITLPDFTGTVPLKESVQTWSAPQRSQAPQASTGVNGSTTLALETYQNFKLTTSGNFTLANPTLTNCVGQCGVIEVVNGASHTMAVGNEWKFAGGDIDLTGSSATDLVVYFVQTTSLIHATLVKDIKTP